MCWTGNTITHFMHVCPACNLAWRTLRSTATQLHNTTPLHCHALLTVVNSNRYLSISLDPAELRPKRKVTTPRWTFWLGCVKNMLKIRSQKCTTHSFFSEQVQFRAWPVFLSIRMLTSYSAKYRLWNMCDNESSCTWCCICKCTKLCHVHSVVWRCVCQIYISPWLLFSFHETNGTEHMNTRP